MDRVTTDKSASVWSSKAIILTLGLVLAGIFSSNSAYSAWFERLVPKGETYIVKEVDRDAAFVINDFIYDARQFCYLSVGDKVVFFEGRYGIDYRATIYDLDSRERCELLLRDEVL